MIKPYFWMNLAYWLNLEIIIRIGGKRFVGYLETPKNQFGSFYLANKQKCNLITHGKTDSVEYASIFWGFIFHKPAVITDSVVEKHETKDVPERLISGLPVSLCLPVDGNIPHLEIPPVKISTPKPWENKFKRNPRKK